MMPLRFQPLIKRARWGGSRLGSVLKKSIGTEDDYAESWELSDHGARRSRCARLAHLAAKQGRHTWGRFRNPENFRGIHEFGRELS